MITLKLGDKDVGLSTLQDFLIQNGFLNTREYFYGIKTYHAVQELQKYLGIEPTGEFDDSIYSLYDIKKLQEMQESISTYARVNENTIQTDNATTQQTFKESDADLSGLNFPAYIQNLLTGTTIKIPVMIEEVSWTKGNNYDETETKGRSASYLGYANSTSKTLSFSFTITEDLVIGESLYSYCNKLEALAYPRYGSYIAPPKAFFRCGDIKLEGVVTEVSVTLKPPIINNVYTIAEVSISMTETYAEGISATTIEGR